MEAANLRLVYLGYYMPDWSGKNNAEFAINRGFEVRTETPDQTGDLWGYSSLDEDFSIVNQYLKYLWFLILLNPSDYNTSFYALQSTSNLGLLQLIVKQPKDQTPK